MIIEILIKGLLLGFGGLSLTWGILYSNYINSYWRINYIDWIKCLLLYLVGGIFFMGGILLK